MHEIIFTNKFHIVLSPHNYYDIRKSVRMNSDGFLEIVKNPERVKLVQKKNPSELPSKNSDGLESVRIF